MTDILTIGLNARPLANPEGTGVARYTRALLDALATHHPDHEFRLFGVETVPESLADYGAITNAEESAPTHSGLRAHIWEQTTLPLAIHDHDIDVFHTPGGNLPLLTHVPTVTTVHDLAPVVHPEWFSREYGLLYRVTTPLVVRRSDYLLTPSRFTRDEVVSTYPSAAGKTTVAHHGPPALPNRRDPVDALDDGSFFLVVGTGNPRKNSKRVQKAYRRYRGQTDDPAALVLAGPSREIFADTREIGEGVHAVGYLTDAELEWCYEQSRALVYPTLYEGFGFPILEAMQAGTPVITSDRGAMAEVADEAALLVDPESVPAIADALERVSDSKTASDLVSAGQERVTQFDWTETAQITVETYREATR